MGAVTGSGHAKVTGATLDADSSFGQDVRFVATSAVGVLELVDSRAYGGTISGFSPTGATELDLGDMSFVSAGEATFVENSKGTAGVLTVTDGSHEARIHLLGDYASSTFEATSDGHAGTLVIASIAPAPSVNSSPHSLISAISSVTPPAQASTHPEGPRNELVRPPFVASRSSLV